MIGRISKRKSRRQRYLARTRLRALDAKVLQAIRGNIMWSMSTWSGTRCPGCGIPVRPHWLTDNSGELIMSGQVVGFIDGFGAACDYVKNCPGEREWC